ncbi:MAG: carbohydrate ABC transporter permease [Chloroflexota bacterium]
MERAPAAAPASQSSSVLVSRSKWLTEARMAYLLNLPALILILVLTIYPIVDAFWISLHQYTLRRPDVFPFIGVQNYLSLIETSDFWNSLRVTILFTFWTTLLVLVIAVGVGLVLNEPFRGRGIMRTLILLPWAMPGVVNALMWQWVYNGEVGILNGALYSLGIINHYHAWLIDAGTMFPSLIFANVWNTFPFSTLIILAALQAVPSELYDAARVDRAGVFDRFRSITLPWLIQPILIVLILQTLGGLRLFDIIYLLTGGGPGNDTTTIGYAAYQTAFLDLNFGLGNAYSYIIAFLTLFIALVYMRLLWNKGDVTS